MSDKIEAVNVCEVKGVLFEGRAICGEVGCGEPWKCWSEDQCVHKVILNPESVGEEK